MIQALQLSFQSLSDRRVAMLLIKVVLCSFASFLLLGVGMWFALDRLFEWLNIQNGEYLSTFLSLALIPISAFLLFRVVAVAITWIFADDIIDAVEDRYYPQKAAFGKRPGFGAGVHMAVRSIARVVGYNLLALPLYIVLLVTGIGTAIAFMLLNALLLGKDLEDMLIARHGASQGSIQKLPRLLLGFIGTVGMLIPFFNLLVPVLATAMAVHLVHSGSRAI
ncbi:EI24 domain-containing protein [Sphingorhabdus sp.]|uniref:EI24 domain-containing protein n=1 Tax=Sphingorhabdus sp. TaxID=1902408 RepID=UPI0037C92FC0